MARGGMLSQANLLVFLLSMATSCWDVSSGQSLQGLQNLFNQAVGADGTNTSQIDDISVNSTIGGLTVTSAPNGTLILVNVTTPNPQVDDAVITTTLGPTVESTTEASSVDTSTVSSALDQEPTSSTVESTTAAPVTSTTDGQSFSEAPSGGFNTQGLNDEVESVQLPGGFDSFPAAEGPSEQLFGTGTVGSDGQGTGESEFEDPFLEGPTPGEFPSSQFPQTPGQADLNVPFNQIPGGPLPSGQVPLLPNGQFPTVPVSQFPGGPPLVGPVPVGQFPAVGIPPNGFPPNQFVNGFRPNGLPVNQIPNIPFPNNQFPNSQFPISQFPGNQFPNSQFPNQFPNTQFPNNQFPNTQFPNNQFPNSQFPNNQFPNTQFPNNQFPNTQFPNNQFPNSQFPNAQFPNSQFPNSQFPNSQFPTNQIPNSQFPNNQFPTNNIPNQNGNNFPNVSPGGQSPIRPNRPFPSGTGSASGVQPAQGGVCRFYCRGASGGYTCCD